ncbi:amino acid transporter AVT1B-like [Penaeus japonicus]|uniref:amino acid transporter AVT1B-like n=1 Tax=Penaeus japonicus TaxID=27405 RepID=UPI001C715BAF|nr:amino acid transporter AVT1B-like [Penaeus japonicus]XP_042870540.1 amino acid transporter AVT1B-like [Penaeus japonicus]XP_042870541.1 amino acid transporter AVT1B-like [Penaeus japonicus]
MSAQETTALLGYGGTPRILETPPTPRRSFFETQESSQQVAKLPEPPQGISVFTAICYMVGVFGVMPVVALPGAIVYCGWPGFLIASLLLLTEAYTATLLGRSWLLLEVFWPREAATQRRYPYPALAEKAGGPILRKIVSCILDVALFGAAVPFMLLAAETLQTLVARLAGLDFSFCYWLLITTFFLTPLLWYGTPKDLGLVTWLGAGSVVVVSLLTLISLTLDAPAVAPPAPDSTPSWTAIAYCFGAVAFQFDIHPMILTVQSDMREKSRLPVAVIVAFIMAATTFGSVSVVAYTLYGQSVKTNILNNLSGGPLLYANMAIVALQMLLCLVLGINTLFQDLENKLQIPDSFGWRRICLRTLVMLAILFVCESIPHFGVAIELVGGFLVTPFIFIFPPIFHILIKKKASGRVDVKDLVLASNVVTIGLIGSYAATSESFIQVFQLTDFAPPCYINLTAATSSIGQDSSGFQNQS